jgi:large subunit ribosomal protein L6
MSRIGNKTITVPSGVDVNINGTTVTVKGSKGTLTQTFRDVTLEQDDNILFVKRANEGRNVSVF